MQFLRKTLNLSGNDVLLTTAEIDYAHRVLSLTGTIDEETADGLCSALRELARDSNDEITLYINSPGGDVSAGFAILDTLKAVNCDICTVASGLSASMAALILATGGTKGRRYAQQNAKILIHQPLAGISGQATDIRIHAKNILDVKAKLNRMLSEASGQSIKKIARDTERDFIMTANEALAYGLIDIIGDPVSEHNRR